MINKDFLLSFWNVMYFWQTWCSISWVFGPQIRLELEEWITEVEEAWGFWPDKPEECPAGYPGYLCFVVWPPLGKRSGAGKVTRTSYGGRETVSHRAESAHWTEETKQTSIKIKQLRLRKKPWDLWVFLKKHPSCLIGWWICLPFSSDRGEFHDTIAAP